MKKMFVFLFACCLLAFSVAFASAEYNFSAMTDSELQAVLNAARNEMLSRAAKISGKMYLIKSKDVEIYFTGKGRKSWSGFEMEVVCINNTKSDIYFSCDYVTINGWQLNGFDDIPIVGPGNKAFGAIYLDYQSVGLSDISEIEEVVIANPYVFNDNYVHVAKARTLTIDFQGCEWE